MGQDGQQQRAGELVDGLSLQPRMRRQPLADGFDRTGKQALAGLSCDELLGEVFAAPARGQRGTDVSEVLRLAHPVGQREPGGPARPADGKGILVGHARAVVPRALMAHGTDQPRGMPVGLEPRDARRDVPLEFFIVVHAPAAETFQEILAVGVLLGECDDGPTMNWARLAKLSAASASGMTCCRPNQSARTVAPVIGCPLASVGAPGVGW